MGRNIGLEATVDHFTLDTEQLGALRNKAGATRLGFALMWRFLLWRGRFPRTLDELPDDAAEHVARQVEVPASALARYELAERQASNHRREIRRYSGFHPCTVADAERLTAWLAAGPARDERRAAPLRAALLAHCHAKRIEPPAPDRLARIVDSGTRQAETAQVALVMARLNGEHVARLEALIGLGESASWAADESDDAAKAQLGGGSYQADTDVLSAIRTRPGNVSLASLFAEIRKLEATRAIDLPADLFAAIHDKVVAVWRDRASVESPSHLRAHEQPVRLVLLAVLIYLRQREITDTLVELLNSIIHKINARADKTVTEAFVRQHKRNRNANTLLGQVAEVSLAAPEKNSAGRHLSRAWWHSGAE